VLLPGVAGLLLFPHAAKNKLSTIIPLIYFVIIKLVYFL